MATVSVAAANSVCKAIKVDGVSVETFLINHDRWMSLLGHVSPDAAKCLVNFMWDKV